MCFSPTASFTSAVVLAAIGAACVARVKAPRELPLAATPLLFALQQAIEGGLWLTLPESPQSCAASGLTLGFLILAHAFWPAFASVAAFAIEPEPARRRLIAPWLLVGAGVSATLVWTLITEPQSATIIGDHIVYGSGPLKPDGGDWGPGEGGALLMPLAYVAAVCLPLMLSSWRAVAVMGVIVTAGCAVAYVAYYQAFQSVWCYFAAAASAAILWHFETAQRRASAPAAVR